MADPALTGELIGCLAMLGPVLNGHLSFVPDFERQILNGDMETGGSFQLWLILVVLWKLYFNKNLRRFIRKVKRAG